MRNNVRTLSMGIITILMVSVLIFASGCGKSANTSQSGATSAKKSEFTIKISAPGAPEDSCTMAYLKFKELVEKKSNGRIAVNVFPNGQLGDTVSNISQIQGGNLQAAEVNVSLLSTFDPEFAIFELPYIAKDMDHLIRILQSGIGDKMSANLESKSGIKIVSWLVRSPRNVFSSKGPINTVDDMKGLKIRVMQSPVMLKTMEMLGAQPVAISSNELYTALQTNVVQAAENSVPFILTSKYYEVTKFLSLTEHFYTPNVLAMDAKFFNKLPDDLKKIVMESGKEIGDYEVQVERSKCLRLPKRLKAKA